MHAFDRSIPPDVLDEAYRHRIEYSPRPDYAGVSTALWVLFGQHCQGFAKFGVARAFLWHSDGSRFRLSV